MRRAGRAMRAAAGRTGAAIVAALAAAIAWGAPAPGTGAPAALVEDVQGRAAGVEFMDYVAAGRVIALGPDGTIVLGYLKSCWRETIRGGTLTVGEAQSTVRGGEVQRTRVACEGDRAAAGRRDATQSAATVFRSLRDEVPPAAVHGLSPLVDVGGRRGVLRIERLDPAGEAVEVAIGGTALVAGRFVDLAAAGIALAPEATYVARLGPSRLVFRIDAAAQPGVTPAIGRLLRLP